ncbi:non-canonical purine NTP pyrophosphatase [Dolosicoccus paucivorans]|uniref:Non-canonical purine NTP pyrophosphatase n=1 Tax=Dolosicoccus paucivorans TaxID=84521 RepID=A0A1G8N384_9LACT|nr:non-canonical purine NTP pyrophosphatase [Dolosicoccus paucivorans]PMB84355.1 non-canonical purine NTP pyrophosphatase [Dolosicoccus paucivorans]PMC58104.1 non-canonical purine NTP pyrophosphatase [Dolosicoccus paucivorans]SDI74623.1 XTP/dITP diphosphohydrolase [Dolosicoccus paucivorans]
MIYGTDNQAKIKELSPWSPVPLESYRAYINEVIDIEETGASYAENATLKALTIAKEINCPVLGDDGGLELEDFPNLLGLKTKRFFAPGSSEFEMNEQILELYDASRNYSRKATLVACLVYAYPDGRVVKAESRLPFTISSNQRGSNGYGFDSILVVPKKDVTVAQLPKEEAVHYSARVQAFKQLLNQLKG